ncbi:transposase [Pseudomonas mohnii]
MKRFIQDEHRGQGTSLPESLDDYVSDTNPVRAVDVFVDELDLVNLGFEGAIPAETGRPADHPVILLKIYINGYLNRIPSSRRLEREAQRNVELVWLTGRLMPDFKTIANFRKNNSKAIQGVCRQFVVLCQQLGLFRESLVAIDGSQFKAVNNRDRNFTSAKLKRRMEEIESSINRYLAELDAADRQEPTASEPSAGRLEEKIAKLKTQMKELQGEEMQLRLNNAPEMMRVRKRTVEHPFGTLKQWMGATHFLTRKLAGVSAEMSLNVLACNLERVMKIIGANGLMKALSA